MQEAARLLKANELSVSEVGYQTGFSNLSHFSRTFEKYIGMKLKRYARHEVKINDACTIKGLSVFILSHK
jgi:AraC-like DNA-binding protein